ncbi:DNA-binding transcriptional LysR family regulator [Tsukamurella ocularis]|nr:DNA-binding transcriptional LysR family regulator [Tsukamurella ocularis]MCS3789281.1 DNA-binding transcriptional LysR family regulator [Tsukamurella ocularis]MCS3853131.1 DNA-binding transcriptional LysR family regulator [Tsukamurella ocularis]
MTRAAAELHLTHSAVSRQIASLESHLAQQLFVRDGRGVTPTDEARAFAAAVARALDMIVGAADTVRRPAHQPLVVSCEPTLLQRWLLPRLAGFSTETPLHLSTSGGPVEFRTDAIDAAIRRDDFTLSENTRVRTLFAEWIGPVCHPDALTADGADASSLVRLNTQTRPDAWDTWTELSGRVVADGSTQSLEHFFLTLQAASAGLGIAIGSYPMVADDLSTGRLIAPWGFVPDGSRYVVLTPESAPPARTESLFRWLCDQPDTVPPPHLQARRP